MPHHHRVQSHSARRLPLRAGNRIWKAKFPAPVLVTRRDVNGKLILEDDTDLKSGWALLHSYYQPSLKATADGTYTITVNQTVTSKGDPDLPMTSTQTFNVVAPQYSLPAGEIHSVYPPQGNSVPARILPHVVLNTPHLPWERVASIDTTVPWLALLAFDPSEITLTDAELSGSACIFPRNVSQSNTLSVNLSISEIVDSVLQQSIVSPITASSDDPTQFEFIFVPTGLFAKYVTKYDTSGIVQQQSNANVDRYKYLAHSRNVNTTGMSNADIDQDGLFSVVVAHRTGHWDIAVPSSVVVHLVSIESVEAMTWPLAAKPYVALCSLYSWTYQVQPSGGLDVADTLIDLGRTRGPLSIPMSVDPPISQRVQSRMQDGFTLTRYRVSTGEETVAFYRGPLTPTTVAPQYDQRFELHSSCSSDLQVLDAELGIMDISYSTAWQLGKTLAMTDSAFTAALSRLRNSVMQTAAKEARKAALGSKFLSAADALDDLRPAIDLLRDVPLQRPENRWHKAPLKDKKDLSLWSSDVHPHLQQFANAAALDLAQSRESGFYNEQNTPISPDWATVLQWTLDRMYLISLPAHYYIPEPVALPPESLRFFSIDTNWIDAMLDGALSLANTNENGSDTSGTAIKNAIATYLDNVDQLLGYKPQIPTFGFLLRSDIVKQYPDLVVKAAHANADNKTAPILRQDILDTGTMIVLFDRTPGSSDFTTIELTQPPHQQRFAVGADLNIVTGTDTGTEESTLKLLYQRMCTSSTADISLWTGFYDKDLWTPNSSSVPIFDFDNRLLIVPSFVQTIYNNLTTKYSAYFAETEPTAAMTAIQLNDPILQVEICPQATAASVHGSSLPHSMRSSISNSQQVKTYEANRPLPRTGIATGTKIKNIPSKSSSNIIKAPMPHWTRILKHSTGTRTQSRPAKRTQGSLPRTISSSGWIPNKPLYNYSVYPLGDPNGDKSIPTKLSNQFSQDLVFSIQLPPDQRNLGRFNLKELTIRVPTGSTQDQSGPYLLESYSGPGPTMLSNLRFNVKCQVDSTDSTMLLLRLLPRSTDLYLASQMIDEASFIWPMVQVNAYGGTSLLTVDMIAEEHYTFQSQPNPYTSPVVAMLSPSS